VLVNRHRTNPWTTRHAAWPVEAPRPARVRPRDWITATLALTRSLAAATRA
jgi:hypothetical protein